jgi:hypothetical protein
VTIPDGAVLQVVAPGETFPAFSGSVAAPAALRITSPELHVFPDAYPLSKGQSLTLRWEAGSPADTLEIVFTSLYGALVLCHATDDGELTIPWEHLAKLPRGTNELEGFFERRHATRVDTAVGPVEISAASIENGTFFVEP